MLRKITALVLVAVIWVMVCAPSQARYAQVPPLPAGMQAPDFTAYSWAGGKTHLSDYRGRIVVLDFWATWCPPCNAAMPHMQEVLDQYKDDITLLALCVWDTPANANTWIHAHNYTFDFALDPAKQGPGSISDIYHVWGIPTTYIIDPNGVIYTSGVVMSKDDLVSAIRALGARTVEEHAQAAAAQKALLDKDGMLPGEMLLNGAVSSDYTGQGPLIISVTSVRLYGEQAHVFNKPRQKNVTVTASTQVTGASGASSALHFKAGDKVRVIGQDHGAGKDMAARLIQPQP